MAPCWDRLSGLKLICVLRKFACDAADMAAESWHMNLGASGGTDRPTLLSDLGVPVVLAHVPKRPCVVEITSGSSSPGCFMVPPSGGSMHRYVFKPPTRHESQ